MNVAEFLRAVVTSEAGWLNIASLPSKPGSQEWKETWLRWPGESNLKSNTDAEAEAAAKSSLESIEKYITDYRDTHNLYFSPHVFSGQSARKELVLPTRTIIADLDDADVTDLILPPSLLVETSPQRYQGYWLLKNDVGSLEEHEELSRRLTYAIPRCDRTGWHLGKRVRLPDTYNHKYISGPQPVKIIEADLRLYELDRFDYLPIIAARNGVHDEDYSWVKAAEFSDIGPLELLESLRPRMPARVLLIYDKEVPDRSAALWALMLAAFRAGASKEQVYIIAKNSANNKFRDLRDGGMLELAKDVLRAEVEAANVSGNAHAAVREARSVKGSPYERKEIIANIVREDLLRQGQFINCTLGGPWYVNKTIGKPVPIITGSEQLAFMLDTAYGLNPTEQEARYAMANLMSNCASIVPSGSIASLSYYDNDTNTVLLHTGRKTVMKIGARSTEQVTDGYNGIVFQWISSNAPFSPMYPDEERNNGNSSISAVQEPWYETMFGDCFDNIIGMDREQAITLVRIWVHMVLLRNKCISRPVLALLGQPGCLSGETAIAIRRGGHSARLFTLADAYHRSRGTWDKNIPTRVLSEKDGVVQWRTVTNIVRSGRKLTYLVRVGERTPIRATEDHRFLTPSGYKVLKDLKPGDDVVVMGDRPTTRGRNLKTRTDVSANHHPYARQKMVNGYGPYGSIKLYRAVLEADLNKLSLDEFLRIVHKDTVGAQKLQYLPEDVHIHHKDHNPGNNSLDNLQAMTKLEHDTHHGHENLKSLGEYSGMWETATDKIISIEEYGEEETYDIQMEDEDAPNFLVNGVVVHNSGKSTLFRRVYALLYGGTRSLNAITNPDDFDFAVATDPVVVLDNVDGKIPWLPDRLALSAANSEFMRRKLYTNAETVTLRRQAMVGITAHNPQWIREDVADRLVVLNFERIQEFKPEGLIIERILKARNSMWGQIIRELQKVLAQPAPEPRNVPQFRIEDFASIGYWIASALGVQDIFQSSIKYMRNSQRSLALEQDGLLIDAITRWHQQALAKDPSKLDEFRAPGQLWSLLTSASRDERQFTHEHVNALRLGRKLWALQDALKSAFDIEWKYDTGRHMRMWRIRPMTE